MPLLRVATNAGPLIYLSVVGRFALLKTLFAEVQVPEGVYQEVVVLGSGQPGAVETEQAVADGWLRRVAVTDRIAVDALLPDLHVGEAEAIVLAREAHLDGVLLDDRAARNRAQAMGLKVTGTIGILLLARESGVPIDLRQDLDRLVERNFRVSPALYAHIIGHESKDAAP